MLDELLEIFERDKKHGAAKPSGGLRGRLSRLFGGSSSDSHASETPYAAAPRRRDDDDDDDDDRRYRDDRGGDRSRRARERDHDTDFGWD